MSRKKELQSLLNERTLALSRAERKVEDMNIVIADLEKQEELYREEKRNLRLKNFNQKELISKISKLVVCNKYNNEKAVLGKIKELVTDYQSTTNSK